MYSWCTREEWLDDYFDLDYIRGERGTFRSYDEARADAERHGYNKVVVLNLSD